MAKKECPRILGSEKPQVSRIKRNEGFQIVKGFTSSILLLVTRFIVVCFCSVRHHHL